MLKGLFEMRSFRDSNLLLLKELHPGIYQYYSNNQIDYSNVVEEPARNNDWNLVVRTEQDNNYMYSKYNPVNEAERWVEQSAEKINTNKHILLIGVGLGYHLEALLARFPEKTVYLIEPDLIIFYKYMELRDMKALSNKSVQALFIGDEKNHIRSIGKIISSSVNEGFVMLSTAFYQKNYSKIFEDLNTEGKKMITQYRSNLLTVKSNQAQWFENIILNYPVVMQSLDVSCIKNKFNNVPAIIVGSGPSLKYDFEMLRKIKGKCLIIAAGTSIQPLTMNGIEPDLVVSIDGSAENYKAFESIDLSNVPLLYASMIHKDILTKRIGKLLHSGLGTDKITEYILPENMTPTAFVSTMSVTGTAIQAACYMGCNPVLFTGQDMSFPNDEYYAAGTNHISDEKKQKYVRHANRKVINVYGEYNRSMDRMDLTRRNLEVVIRHYEKTKFINCSQHGAVIEGAPFEPLEQVASTYILHRDRFDSLYDFLCSIDLNITERCKTGEQRLRDFQGEIYDLQDKIQVLYEQLEKIQELITNKNDKKCEQHLLKINRSWSTIGRMSVFSEALSQVIELNSMIMLRNMPAVSQEKDIKKKLQLIDKNLGLLVRNVKEILPGILSYIDIALEQFNAIPKAQLQG
jgi:Uncharacterized protein conserved in bacteria